MTLTIHDTDILDGVEVAAEFAIDAESYPAEPYSYGGSRGTEIRATAELVSLQLGGLKLDVAQACEMLGRDRVARLEDLQATLALERMEAGETV